MKRKKGMRNIMMLMCIALLTGILLPSVQTEAASQKGRALQAYEEYLKEHPSSVKKFAIAYIDNDKLPELLYQGNNYLGQTYIYTYRKGKIEYIGKIGTAAMWIEIYPKKKMIIERYAWGGYTATNQFTYYRYSRRGLQKCLYQEGWSIMSSGGYSGWDYGYTNYKNGKKAGSISKRCAKRKLKKLVGSTKAKKVTFHDNNTINRTKYLK